MGLVYVLERCLLSYPLQSRVQRITLHVERIHREVVVFHEFGYELLRFLPSHESVPATGNKLSLREVAVAATIIEHDITTRWVSHAVCVQCIRRVETRVHDDLIRAEVPLHRVELIRVAKSSSSHQRLVVTYPFQLSSADSHFTCSNMKLDLRPLPMFPALPALPALPMLSDFVYKLSFRGNFSYTRHEDGTIDISVHVGEEGSITVIPAQKIRNELELLNDDVIACVVDACDVLSLAALSRCCTTLRRLVAKDMLWRDKTAELRKKYPFVKHIIETSKPEVLKKLATQTSRRYAIYLATMLEKPEKRFMAYTRVKLHTDDLTQHQWCKIVESLRKEYPESKLYRRNNSAFSCTIRDENGTKASLSLTDRYLISKTHEKYGKRYNIQVVATY
jgi:hypothetical protein